MANKWHTLRSGDTRASGVHLRTHVAEVPVDRVHGRSEAIHVLFAGQNDAPDVVHLALIERVSGVHPCAHAVEIRADRGHGRNEASHAPLAGQDDALNAVDVVAAS
eukprot:4634853-Lingulodinium_polyedra.AAC.1